MKTSLIVSSVFFLLLAACAQPPPPQNPTVVAAQQQIIAECRAYYQQLEAAELNQLATLSDKDRAMVLVVRTMANAMAGNVDPCTIGQDGYWQAYEAYYAAHAREFEAATGLGGTIAIGGFTYAGLKSILSGVGDTSITNNGDGNSVSEIRSDYSARQYYPGGDNSVFHGSGESGGYDPSLGCSYETWFSNGGFCPQ